MKKIATIILTCIMLLTSLVFSTSAITQDYESTMDNETQPTNRYKPLGNPIVYIQADMDGMNNATAIWTTITLTPPQTFDKNASYIAYEFDVATSEGTGNEQDFDGYKAWYATNSPWITTTSHTTMIYLSKKSNGFINTHLQATMYPTTFKEPLGLNMDVRTLSSAYTISRVYLDETNLVLSDPSFTARKITYKNTDFYLPYAIPENRGTADDEIFNFPEGLESFQYIIGVYPTNTNAIKETIITCKYQVPNSSETFTYIIPTLLHDKTYVQIEQLVQEEHREAASKNGYIYIKELTIEQTLNDEIKLPIDESISSWNITINTPYYAEKHNLLYNYYISNFAKISSPNGPITEATAPFTEWLGVAIGGVMNFPIAENFTLGMIITTFICIAMALWILKVFAGG